MKHVLLSLVAFVVLGVLAGGVIVFSGAYNISADTPHTGPTLAVINTLRDRSIARRAADVEPPADLADAERIRRGAGNYDAMCVNCHLRPGMNATELTIGLYPAPPNFSEQVARSPEEAFWVTKHGIKATGMPAWGMVMPDEYIWDMVAFLERLPEMDQQEYQSFVDESPGHSHSNGNGEEAADQADDHDHPDGDDHDHEH